MLKKTITYDDYNGLKRTEDHYFNISEGEVVEMQMGTDGGYTEMLTRIVAAQDMPALFKNFRDLILNSYGQKSLDGKRFIKKDPATGRRLADDFVETEAYSVLLMELCSNTQAAIDFVNAVMPNKTAQQTTASIGAVN